MREREKAAAVRELRQIPGVGASIAEDLWNIGVRSIADLRGQSADDLYERICLHQRALVDRCMLYTMRCAVYYASNTTHDPELLKWWRWKDEPKPARTPA